MSYRRLVWVPWFVYHVLIVYFASWLSFLVWLSRYLGTWTITTLLWSGFQMFYLVTLYIYGYRRRSAVGGVGSAAIVWTRNGLRGQVCGRETASTAIFTWENQPAKMEEERIGVWHQFILVSLFHHGSIAKQRKGASYESWKVFVNTMSW